MKFSEIIGHETVKTLLINTVKNNRVSHAQLFLGPEGCGKLALAIAYAQYLSCTGFKEMDSCGDCPSCIKYQKLVHPDLHFVYPISQTKATGKKMISKDLIKEWRNFLIQNDYQITLNAWYNFIEIENKIAIINESDCDEIIKTLSLMPYESKYKIQIIWMAEKINYAAAPKILKILEEPPQNTIFILVAENIDHILNTILSRTQMVKISKYSDKEIFKALKEKYGISDTDAFSASSMAEGNLPLAITFSHDIDKDNYNFTTFREYLRLSYSGKNIEMFVLIEKIAGIGREKQKSLLIYGIRIIRQCLLINNSSTKLVKKDSEKADFLNKFSVFINISNITDIVEELNKAVFHIERNGNAKLIFTDLGFILHKLLRNKE